jgi:hypothetical protein
MNHPFLVRTKAAPGISAAVFSPGSRSPMDEVDLLEGELRKKKVCGAVLFDLLLVNGNKDRYYLATFDGEHFAPCRMQNVDSRRSEFCWMSAAVYKEIAEQGGYSRPFSRHAVSDCSRHSALSI